MRFKYYGALVALTSVLALGCASAPPAGAFSWWTGNAAAPHEEKELKTGETAAFTETVFRDSQALEQEAEKGTYFTCTKTTIEKGVLEGPTGGSAHALKFSGCEVKAPTGCTFTGGEETITTTPVTMTLHQSSGKTLVEVKPASGQVLATFGFSNTAACGSKKGSKRQIEGYINFEIPNAAECLAEQSLVASKSLSDVTWGARELESFAFAIAPKLASGKCWAAH